LLGLANSEPRCSDEACNYSKDGFPTVGGQPVLIDFENSIFDRDSYRGGDGSVLPRDNDGRNFRSRLRRFLNGENRIAAEKAQELLTRLANLQHRPVLLVVGGGARGSGTEALYDSAGIDRIGTDVYASPYTDLVADGHSLPFKSASFDAVWIQAVLEHVVEPSQVAAEIYRVLRPGGLVFADTPFMQQVHEKAYDFTRFTLSGHRWLFRRFEQIDAGAAGGAGTATVWSIRYLVRALGSGDKLATLAALPFFWLRFLDRLTKRRPNADAASGVYFFGIKSDRILTPKDMVAFYETQNSDRSG
jgi:SAM-dependent methyltransferase